LCTKKVTRLSIFFFGIFEEKYIFFDFSTRSFRPMDSDTLDPELIPLICRICLLNVSDTMFSIYDNDSDEMLFTDKILQCTDVEIKRHSELPDKICEKCVQDLEASYRFRMNVESSDAILQNYLKRFNPIEVVTPAATSTVRKIKQEYEMIGVESADEAEEEGDEEEEQDDPTEIGYQIEEFLDDNEEPDVEIKYEHEVYAVEHDQELLNKLKYRRPKEESSSGGEKKMRRVKGPKPPQICDICGAPFSSKTELNAHMRRHLGERPYKCEHCDKAFTSRPRVGVLKGDKIKLFSQFQFRLACEYT
jgi:hypothetical protein